MTMYLVVPNDDNILESSRLEVYNQLLPNGLVNLLGMELLAL